ncbi:MAG: 5-(carboxyamino)imidazole ribonucleotide mutase [Verrucomicrobia bacterium]|nr:MAG: 5-(carboxyamino)imidazole ribonucleotide mutase [Verrucomicrobiota bacterium]
MAADKTKPLVGILMGSKSDWEVMQHCAAQLEDLDVPWEAQAICREVIIAAAGGAAHLQGVCAAKTTLPVLGVPMESPSLKGLDSLLSIVQMPGGVPVGTLAIGKPGAINAALLAVSILGARYPEYRKAYGDFRRKQTANVLSDRVLKLSETPAKKH